MSRAPAPDPGPDESLAKPFRLMLLTIGSTLAAVGVLYLLSGKPRTGSVGVSLAATTVVAWGLLERGRFAIASGVFFYALALGLLAFLWTGYGVRDYGILGYAALLFAGCVFLSARAYWGLAALVLAGVGAFGVAELAGVVRNSFSPHVTALSLTSLLLVLAASAAGGRVLMHAMRSSAARARELSGALGDSEAALQRVFRSSQSALSVSRLADGLYLDVNDAFLGMFGMRREQVIGRTSTEIGIWGDPRDRERFVQVLRERRVVRDLDLRLHRSSGEAMECQLSGEVLEVGGQPCVLSSVADVTARRSAERRARFLSTRDPLTGLPNRVLALDRLQQAVERARRIGACVALVHVGIDRFKAVNESLGHDAGDAVLREAVARIGHAIGEGDTLARVAGDEFLVIAQSVRDAADADRLAHAVMATFDTPFTVEGRTARVACTAGVALCPDDSTEAQALLRQAESAMHFGKAAAPGTCRRFEPAMAERIRDQLFVETSLRQGLAAGELRLLYQPKFDLKTGRVAGLEALCRWTHPELGEVHPARFVAIAEQSDLIRELGRWVLAECCAQVARWRREGRAVVPVAVNLSARQLAPDLPGIIADCVRSAAIEPADLEIEVTEGMLIANPEATRRVLEDVARAGTRIVLDDFGVGYSSLGYVKHLPLQGLKIDRTFVRDIAEGGNDGAIVTAIVTLAHGLGLRVVAEGVETAAQREAIARLGCDEGQGYHFSHPVEGAEVAARFLSP